MKKFIPLFAATFLSVSFTTSAMAASGDYLCKAKLFGERAQLWLKNEKPVQYQWHNRPALPAQMRGTTIYISADPVATISNVVIGNTASGQKAIRGDFKFKNNRKTGLVFSCKAK